MRESEKYLFSGKRQLERTYDLQRFDVLPAGLKAGKRKADIGPGVPTTTIMDENCQAELIYVTPPRPPLNDFWTPATIDRKLPVDRVVTLDSLRVKYEF